jgi:chitosanase
MQGPGDASVSFGGIRKTVMKKAKTPAQGGDECPETTKGLSHYGKGLFRAAGQTAPSTSTTKTRVSVPLMPPCGLPWEP